MNASKFLFLILFCLMACHSDDPSQSEPPPVDGGSFYFGADLSWVNEILDHGGVYKEDNVVKDPYQIFKNKGLNLVRVRLWNNPLWTKEKYGDQGTQLYSDIKDVERTIASAKALGLQVLLDFHYSDTWADPEKQYIPEAWQDIKSIKVLSDSVYNYTFKTLHYLQGKNLQPELVQLGNEINCGLLSTDAPSGFPSCNVCNNQWTNAGEVLNAGIRAVRDVSASASTKTKVILHVADPKNVEWWFDNIKSQALVTDFDMVGFSYYPLWHTTVAIDDISAKVAGFKARFNKDVIILETGYPWTRENADSYNNLFGDAQPLNGFPFTIQGQYDLMKKLTTEVKQGGGVGVIPWEPGAITSGMKDQWGTGSTLDNCAYFDFSGNAIQTMDYMTFQYP
ncbi:glycoside hydrolase family 53 protein [Chryseolinea serpens]|uniref:glycoside hydrolase family 53 protein n=1 Tax=Chryseolinea serpens TaxID=947013 RepID=UPI0015C06371|nr:glycosyl hydrolase 53 family protein [Chryseolinea serpens]